MVEEESGTVRSVAWSEVLPWLSLFRCFRLAIRFRALLLSAVAVLLTLTGWAGFGVAFKQMQWRGGCSWQAVTKLVEDKPKLPGTVTIVGTSAAAADEARRQPTDRSAHPALDRKPEPFFGTWAQLGRPFCQLFDWDMKAEGMTLREFAFLLVCGLWALAVWAFFGGAVCRTAAVELANGERVGWGPMLRHACSKWWDYFLAPILPLVGVLLLTVACLFVGLILLRFDVGVLVAACGWPLMLIAGLLMALLLLGLLFGWPLMWATISAEGTDKFDALSRCYAYVFQRPLHYLFYAIVATGIGILGWLLVSNFAAAVVYFTYWAASWGSGAERMASIINPGGDLGTLGAAGRALIHFWSACVKILAVGFLYSYFWTAATAIYFLLRRDVDATEMDEVFLEEEEGQPAYGLPPLETDDAGAPVVKDEPEVTEEE